MTTKFIAVLETSGECSIGDTLEEAFDGLEGVDLVEVSFFEASPIEVEFKIEKKESK